MLGCQVAVAEGEGVCVCVFKRGVCVPSTQERRFQEDATYVVNVAERLASFCLWLLCIRRHIEYRVVLGGYVPALDRPNPSEVGGTCTLVPPLVVSEVLASGPSSPQLLCQRALLFTLTLTFGRHRHVFTKHSTARTHVMPWAWLERCLWRQVPALMSIDEQNHVMG